MRFSKAEIFLFNSLGIKKSRKCLYHSSLRQKAGLGTTAVKVPMLNQVEDSAGLLINVVIVVTVIIIFIIRFFVCIIFAFMSFKIFFGIDLTAAKRFGIF